MKHAISYCLLGLGLTAATGVHADTTLRLGHLWPAQSAVNQDLIKAWADQVTQDANGALEVEIYPSQTLSKASSAYEGVVNGVGVEKRTRRDEHSLIRSRVVADAAGERGDSGADLF